MNNFIDNFLIARNPEWHWTDFRYRSQQIAQQLHQDNISILAFWFEDSASFACALLAAWQVGARVLLPPNLLDENTLWVKQNAQFLMDDAIFSTYGKSQQVANTPFEWPNQGEIWLKTSGSSGEPKIIRKTAEQMWIESQAIIQSLRLPKGDIQVVSNVSPQHHYGLSYRVILPLTQQWSIARKRALYPEILIAESNLSDNNLWITSPVFLNHFEPQLKHELHSQLCGIVCSGGVLPETTAQKIRDNFNAPLIECYGSSETGAIAFRADNGLWQPTPLTRVGLNEQGALWVESKWLLEREQTADAAILDKEKFKLLGRLDRIIKFADKRISLNQIEHDLLKHPWINDCYIAQHSKRQRPAAWIAFNKQGIDTYQVQGRQAVINELRQYLALTQDKIAIPRYWRFSNKLPRNAQSKISRQDFDNILQRPQGMLNE